jgi:glycosyltransferase involved in cell wall biosynthesis
MYGGIASRLAAVPAVLLAVSGMGYAFTVGNPSLRRRVVGGLSRTLLRLAFGHRKKRVIVQNHDDECALLHAGLVEPRELQLIPGSGVALALYVNFPLESKEPIVLLPARLLFDKGVVEFAQAAALLRAQGCRWQFLLAGTTDYENPSAVPTETIKSWVRDGTVAWCGHVDDMPALYARASIVCLPSYREGMPKALLEAAAAGCAVVTTDVVGCREAIVPGVTGDLVPARDAQALASALKSLIEDSPMRLSYGRAGRALAIERYSLDAVVCRTFEVYSELMEHD